MLLERVLIGVVVVTVGGLIGMVWLHDDFSSLSKALKLAATIFWIYGGATGFFYIMELTSGWRTLSPTVLNRWIAPFVVDSRLSWIETPILPSTRVSFQEDSVRAHYWSMLSRVNLAVDAEWSRSGDDADRDDALLWFRVGWCGLMFQVVADNPESESLLRALVKGNLSRSQIYELRSRVQTRR